MATTIWATPDGGTSKPQDGSSYANAFTIDAAINYLNTQTVTADFFVNLVGTWDITAGSEPPQVMVEGNDSGRINWRGTDTTGASTQEALFGATAGNAGAYVFKASGVLKYHTFRDIRCTGFESGAGDSGFDFRFGVDGCHFLGCRATRCRNGFNLGSTAITDGGATLVQCGADACGSGFVGNEVVDADCIECSTTDCPENTGNFDTGGVAFRCISETSVKFLAQGFTDYGSVIECTIDGMATGVEYTRQEMGYFIGLIVSRTVGAGVLYVNDDSTLSVSGTFWRGLVNDDAAFRVQAFNDGLQFDFDSSGDTSTDPYANYLKGDFALNNDPQGGGLGRNNTGYNIFGLANATYQDVGAVQTKCEGVDTDAQFTGTMTNRSIH